MVLKWFAVQYISTHFWEKICLDIEETLEKWNNAFRKSENSLASHLYLQKMVGKKWLIIKFLSLDRWSIYLTFSHLLQVVLFLYGECEKKPFLRHLTNKAASITKMSNHFLSDSRLNNFRHLFFACSRTQNVIPTEIIHVCVWIGFFGCLW